MIRARLAPSIPLLLPAVLLAVAAALVAAQASRPSAVLDMWRLWGEIGILALPMTAIILTGGIDLSVGSIVALAGVCLGLAWQQGWPLALVALVAPAAGIVCGLFNAALVTAGMAPLVVTLATMALFSGAALALSHGQRVAGLPESLTRWGQGWWLAMPAQLLYFFAAACAAWVVVHHTRFGRYLFAIGDNRLAAEFAGVPVRRVQSCLYAASGLAAGLVASVYCARGGAVVPGAAAGVELQAIACVVVGGTRVTGGAGGIGRTMLGVAILSLLDIGLQFLSRRVYLPWSDTPWHLGANARLILVGLLVIGLAVWNERVAGAPGRQSPQEPTLR